MVAKPEADCALSMHRTADPMRQSASVGRHFTGVTNSNESVLVDVLWKICQDPASASRISKNKKIKKIVTSKKIFSGPIKLEIYGYYLPVSSGTIGEILRVIHNFYQEYVAMVEAHAKEDENEEDEEDEGYYDDDDDDDDEMRENLRFVYFEGLELCESGVWQVQLGT